MCFRPATVAPDKTCPACGATCAGDAPTCSACGADLPQAAMPPHAGRSRRARCSGSAEAAGGAGNARGTREAGGPAASRFGQLARGGRP